MKKSTLHNEIPKLIPRDRSAAEISDDPQRIRTIEESRGMTLGSWTKLSDQRRGNEFAAG